MKVISNTQIQHLEWDAQVSPEKGKRKIISKNLNISQARKKTASLALRKEYTLWSNVM